MVTPYQRNRAAGLCGTCGQIPEPNRAFCLRCKLRGKESRKRWRQSPAGRASQREVSRRYNRREYVRRKQAGLCAYAGCKASSEGGTHCPAHKSYLRNAVYKNKYGITFETRDELLRKQQGLCAICKEPLPEKVHTDHDHQWADQHGVTVIRGLTHGACNFLEGHYKINPGRYQAVVEYHERWATTLSSTTPAERGITTKTWIPLLDPDWNQT